MSICMTLHNEDITVKMLLTLKSTIQSMIFLLKNPVYTKVSINHFFHKQYILNNYFYSEGPPKGVSHHTAKKDRWEWRDLRDDQHCGLLKLDHWNHFHSSLFVFVERSILSCSCISKDKDDLHNHIVKIVIFYRLWHLRLNHQRRSDDEEGRRKRRNGLDIFQNSRAI